MSLSKTEGRTSSSNLPDTLGSASVREKSLCFTQLSLSLNFVSALFCFLVFLFCSRHLERERELFGGITTEKLAYFAFEEERGKRKEETTGVGHWQEREQGACVERAVQQ